MPSSTEIRQSFSRLRKAAWGRMWTRQTLVFLAFVALATVFWLVVSLNETYDVEIAVPLELRDVPSNVVITTELPKEVRVTLRDKGVRLLPYLYGGVMQPITIAFRDQGTNAGRRRIAASELLPQLQKVVKGSTQIVRVKPDTLEYFYNYGASKRVPVRYEGAVQPASGYFIAETKLKPEFVTVYAPQSVLDTLRSVTIQPLYLKDVRDTLTQRQAIATPRGMKAVPAEVSVTLIADRLTEKTVRVPIHALNFPATRVLRTFPSSVDVTFNVGINRYDQINADNFVIALSYEQLVNARSSKANLSLRSVPEGASEVRISPRVVDFVIETVPEEEDSVK